MSTRDIRLIYILLLHKSWTEVKIKAYKANPLPPNWWMRGTAQLRIPPKRQRSRTKQVAKARWKAQMRQAGYGNSRRMFVIKMISNGISVVRYGQHGLQFRCDSG